MSSPFAVTTGIPSMINDVQTIFTGNASTLDKIMAGADILINVAMDVSMVVGVGEGVRALYVGAKVAGHVAVDVGGHALAHEGEDAVEHVVAHDAADLADKVASRCGAMSFAASTLVLTPLGARAIASLKAGDKVTAYDPQTGKPSSQTVEATTIHHDDNLVDVTLKVTTPATLTPAKSTSAQHAGASATVTQAKTTPTTHDEVVHTTANHPWLSADHGWLIASFLHVGEPVRQADGSVATVVNVRSVPGAADMWDLTVSDLHDFAVGNGAFVVHNCGLDGMPDATKLGDGQDYYYKGERRDELTKANGWTKDDKTSAIGPNESQPFRDFIKSRRDPGYVFNDGDWQYHMETWNHEGGGTFYNHYWKNIWEGVGEDNVWHHH